VPNRLIALTEGNCRRRRSTARSMMSGSIMGDIGSGAAGLGGQKFRGVRGHGFAPSRLVGRRLNGERTMVEHARNRQEFVRFREVWATGTSARRVDFGLSITGPQAWVKGFRAMTPP
jgi:hypothetical protein